MTLSSQLLAENVRLLKSRVRKYSIFGALIALVMVVVTMVLTVYAQTGQVTLAGIVDAHRTNIGLWLLETMPFLFALWGLHINSITAYEASVMVMDQTNELRTRSAALEEKLTRNATHDSLTDLPNRVLFHDRLEQVVHNARRTGTKAAVLVLRLANFKEIADTLGHFNGDRLLKQVAVRLSSLVRDDDTVAHFAGEEFAFLLQNIDLEEIRAFVKKVDRAFESPYELEGMSLETRVCIGGAIFPDHGEDANTLIMRADVAMSAALDGKRDFVLFSDKLTTSSPRRLTLVSELRQAIDKDELVLYFQPKTDLRAQRVTEVEALVRWRHGRYGMLPPAEFIDIAESSGLIRPLSHWVLKHALEQQLRWHQAGMEIAIAVNLSARTLLNPDLPNEIAGLLAYHEVPGRMLVCEITETTLMADRDLAHDILTRLAHMGVRISIDDFGTGYSSLAYLKRLPVHEIKIDRSFVTDMLEDRNDAQIVAAVIDLAHNLHLKVVAEGVENKEQLDALAAQGCDMIQGYYISPPIPANEFSVWYNAAGRNAPAVTAAGQAAVTGAYPDDPSPGVPGLRRPA